MSDELVPFTIELIRSLKGYKRRNALDCYHSWLKASRGNDRKESERLRGKINFFIYRKNNPEKVRKYNKNYKQTHKEEGKIWSKRFANKLLRNKRSGLSCFYCGMDISNFKNTQKYCPGCRVLIQNNILPVLNRGLLK